jgi:hypothetical protein
MWSRSDVFGLFSNDVGPFSSNVVPGGRLFSINLVPEQRMFLGQAIYVLGPLHVARDYCVPTACHLQRDVPALFS